MCACTETDTRIKFARARGDTSANVRHAFVSHMMFYVVTCFTYTFVSYTPSGRVFFPGGFTTTRNPRTRTIERKRSRERAQAHVIEQALVDLYCAFISNQKVIVRVRARAPACAPRPGRI